MMETGLARTKLCRAFATLVVAGASYLAAPFDAVAQSRYACSGLEGGTLSVIEAESGMFFRPVPDLIANTRFPEPIVAQIALVAEALESRGSRLVVVPVPSKGLVFQDALGKDAQRFAFDPAIAETLYDDTIARLESQGVTAVNALDALRAWDGEAPMFSSDPRLTNAGIRMLAEAVAERIGTSAGGGFSVSMAGEIEVHSQAHQQIQAKCSLSIPAPVTTGYDTVSLTSAVRGENVLLAGSGLMAGEGLMARALFATALGKDVRHVVSEDAPLDALLAAVSSTAFQLRAPDVVVWAMPVTADLGAFGQRPWREAKGLVRSSCRAVSAGQASRAGDTINVDLSDIVQAQNLGIMLTLDGNASSEARFTFLTGDAKAYSRTLRRVGLEDGTERFLMPLEARAGDEIASVSITIPSGLGDVPALAICGI